MLDGKLTTIRGLGNEIFGANMAQAASKAANWGIDKDAFYHQVMPRVGAYNQSQNKGATGYNSGWPFFFNDPTGMIGEPGEPKLDPNARGGDNNPAPIQEVVITGHKKVQSAFSSFDFNKLATLMTPMRPATPEESAMTDARYGKCGHNDIGCDFTRLWK